jgi:hypothetical protein
MTFPVILPNVGWDKGLTGKIAVALTGMGVNLGQEISPDNTLTSFFDDIVLEEINREYLDHDISISVFVERVREHFVDRGGAWGFKFSMGLGVLLIYLSMYPDASIIAAALNDHTQLNYIMHFLHREDHEQSATFTEIMDYVARNHMYISDAMRFAQSSMIIQEGLFEGNRQKALKDLSIFIGGDYKSGNVTKMVDSAQKKLHHVYTLEGLGSGTLNG